MLKVLHTGDWHIGSFPGPEVNGQNARFQDICRCLDFQAMYAEEHRPDLIGVSGDIFHQARVWSDSARVGRPSTISGGFPTLPRQSCCVALRTTTARSSSRC